MNSVLLSFLEEGVDPYERSFKGTSWRPCPQQFGGHSGLGFDPAWEALFTGKAPAELIQTVIRKGTLPVGGPKSCPHSAHLPVGLDPGLIPSPLESFPVPSRKDSSTWWVCLLALPLYFQSLMEMAQATAVQLTGRIQYPSRVLRGTCTNLQKPMKVPSARDRCGPPPSPENMRFRHGPKCPEDTGAVISRHQPRKTFSTLHPPFDFLGVTRGSLVRRRRLGQEDRLNTSLFYPRFPKTTGSSLMRGKAFFSPLLKDYLFI